MSDRRRLRSNEARLRWRQAPWLIRLIWRIVGEECAEELYAHRNGFRNDLRGVPGDRLRLAADTGGLLWNALVVGGRCHRQHARATPIIVQKTTKVAIGTIFSVILITMSGVIANPTAPDSTPHAASGIIIPAAVAVAGIHKLMEHRESGADSIIQSLLGQQSLLQQSLLREMIT
jgi:hypothetical protein